MKKIIIAILAIGSLALVLFGWWQGSGQYLASADQSFGYIAAGRLAGLLAVWTVLAQVMLTSRANWLEQTFGLDRLTHFHHYNGFVVLLAIIAHGPLLAIGYGARLGQSAWREFWQLALGSDETFQAVLAVAIFILIVAVSVVIIKRHLRYETWYAIHFLTYLAILLAFGHQLELGQDFQNSIWFSGYWILLYVLVGAHVAVYRVIMPLYRLVRHQCTVAAVTPETASTVSIVIRGQALSRLPWRAGQFVIVRFLTKGLWYESHPFSLSCLPNGDHLRLTVKVLGDFTKKLSRQLPIGTPVLISGPHGAFTPEQATHDQAILIAGGIGITPLRPMAEALLGQGKKVT
ncbi:MAG: ferric reductase-like transmembrane domain-containing protein, partial [Patescibacteria group bacterium]